MSIKTHITQEDYTAFLRFVSRSTSTLSDGEKFVRILIFCTVGVGIGIVLSLMSLSSHPTILLAMLSGAFVGAFLVQASMSHIIRRQVRRMRPAEDGSILGTRETFLSDDGIQVKSERYHTVFQWSLVRTIGITEQHIFVMIDRAMGIIYPKRAFSSEAEWEQFVAEIERQTGKVRTPPNTALEPTPTAP